jgi:hypothetical protein
MRAKIVARLRYARDVVTSESFEFASMLTASQFHGDFWNARFASNDRVYTTMYVFDDEARRWRVAEVINWG